MLDKSALYDWCTTCTCNKGYGRLAIREVVARTDLNNFKTRGKPHVFARKGDMDLPSEAMGRRVGARLIAPLRKNVRLTPRHKTFGDNACHPERSEGSLRPSSQTLRCAQGDRQDTSQARSREVLSPNVFQDTSTIDMGSFLWYAQKGQAFPS